METMILKVQSEVSKELQDFITAQVRLLRLLVSLVFAIWPSPSLLAAICGLEKERLLWITRRENTFCTVTVESSVPSARGSSCMDLGFGGGWRVEGVGLERAAMACEL